MRNASSTAALPRGARGVGRRDSPCWGSVVQPRLRLGSIDHADVVQLRDRQVIDQLHRGRSVQVALQLEAVGEPVLAQAAEQASGLGDLLEHDPADGHAFLQAQADRQGRARGAPPGRAAGCRRSCRRETPSSALAAAGTGRGWPAPPPGRRPRWRGGSRAAGGGRAAPARRPGCARWCRRPGRPPGTGGARRTDRPWSLAGRAAVGGGGRRGRPGRRRARPRPGTRPGGAGDRGAGRGRPAGSAAGAWPGWWDRRWSGSAGPGASPRRWTGGRWRRSTA